MKKKNINISLYALIIGATIILLFIFSVVIEIFGYNRFTKSFTDEYNASVLRTAKSAAVLVNADNIDYYLDNQETISGDDEYAETKKELKVLCNTQDMSVVYVVKPDPDYKNITSVFNCLNDNSPYTPWDPGHRTETSDEEYERVYKEMYENGLEEATVVRIDNLAEGLPHVTGLIPLKNSKGEVTGIMCAQRFVEELTDTRKDYVINVGIMAVIAAFISIVTASVFIRSQIIEPLNRVNDEAVRFALENTRDEDVLSGDISKVREINSLADSVDKMEQDTINYINNLTSVTKEKERIGTELSLASAIQEASLNTSFPAFPDRDDFDIYAMMTPAKEVGGDFYDFFLIDDDHLGLVMADVSGKGVPGALFMMVSKILISEHAKDGITPAGILTLVNKSICANNRMNMFVTVWLGILEISTGKVIACNAGHEDPVVYSKDKGFELYKTSHDLMIGFMKDIEYSNYEFVMNKGDKLFLYTDGVPEATNSDKKLFGINRMLETLNNVQDSDAETILREVRESVDDFVGDEIQFDDLTMMCVELK